MIKIVNILKNFGFGRKPPKSKNTKKQSQRGQHVEEPIIEDLEADRKKLAKRIVFWFSLLTLGSGYLLYLSLRLLFSELAGSKKDPIEKRDRLVTFRTDGEYKAIMRGETCVRYVARVENHLLDPQGFDVFKGSFHSYAAKLVKARRKKLAEDPSFVERKLKLDDNGNPLFADEKGTVIPTNKLGQPVNADGQLLKPEPKGFYQLTDELEEAIIQANSTTLFEELFGVYLVGYSPYQIFKYGFRWIKYGQEKVTDDKPSEKVVMHPRDEKVDSLFSRYPQYGVVLDELEIGAGSLGKVIPDELEIGAGSLGEIVQKEGGTRLTKVQAIIYLVFETETTNPQKTLFRTASLSAAGDWQQAISTRIRDLVRPWLGKLDWDTIVSDKKSINEGLTEIVEQINGLDKDGLPDPKAKISSVRDYGQMVIKISLVQANLEDRSLQEAYENVFRAEKKRDADIAKAAGDRALAAAPVQGKADGFKLIADVEDGAEMFMSEQLGGLKGVYAPGRDNMFLNVSERASSQPPQKSIDKKRDQEKTPVTITPTDDKKS